MSCLSITVRPRLMDSETTRSVVMGDFQEPKGATCGSTIALSVLQEVLFDEIDCLIVALPGSSSNFLSILARAIQKSRLRRVERCAGGFFLGCAQEKPTGTPKKACLRASLREQNDFYIVLSTSNCDKAYTASLHTTSYM